MGTEPTALRSSTACPFNFDCLRVTLGWCWPWPARRPVTLRQEETFLATEVLRAPLGARSCFVTPGWCWLRPARRPVTLRQVHICFAIVLSRAPLGARSLFAR